MSNLSPVTSPGPGARAGGAGARRGRRRLVALAAAAAAVLVACGSGTSTGPGGRAGNPAGGTATRSLQPLRIALDYTPNVNYLGIDAAVNRGYFRAEGIEPRIIPYSGASAEQLLQSGRTDLGLTYPPSIPAYRASGLHYEAVAGLSQRDTIKIAVLASSPYRRVAQLSGKLYGGFGVPSDKPILLDVFRRAGVKHPVYREVDLGDQAYRALADHQVAYTIVYGGIDDVTARLSGVKLREWPISRFLGSAFSFPDDAFVATDREVHDHAGLLRRGLAALAKGYEYAARHPAAAESMLTADNRSALAHSTNIVRATGDATAKTFLTPSGTWGRMDTADFAGITRILVRGGLIKASKAPAPTQDFTNRLLPREGGG